MLVNLVFFVNFLVISICLSGVKSGDTDPVPSTSKDVNPSLGNKGQNNPITEEQLAQQKNTINELTKTLNENSNIISNSRKEVLKLMTPEEAKAEASWYKTVVEKVTEITSSISASNSAKNFEQPEQKFKFYTQLTNNLNDAIDIQTRLKNRYTEVQIRDSKKSQSLGEKLKEQKNIIDQLIKHLNENYAIINNSRKKIYTFLNEAESKLEVSEYNQLMSKTTDVNTSLKSIISGGDSVGRTLEQKFQFQAALIKNINDAIIIQNNMRKRYTNVRFSEDDKMVRLTDKVEKLKQAELQRRSNDQKNSPARQQQLAQEYAAGDKLATDIKNQVKALRAQIANVNFDTELYVQNKKLAQDVYDAYKKHLENVQIRRTSEQNQPRLPSPGPQVQQAQRQPLPGLQVQPSVQGPQVQPVQGPQVQPAQWQYNQGIVQQMTANTNRGVPFSKNGKMRTI